MNYSPSKVCLLTIFLLSFTCFTFGQDCDLPHPELTVTETTETTIALAWEPVDGAVAYQINLYTNNGDELLQQIQTEETTCIFEGLQPDTPYALSGQSGCTPQAYGPDIDSLKIKERTKELDLVIVAEDLLISNPCVIRDDGSVHFQGNTDPVPLAPIQSLPGYGIHANIQIDATAAPEFEGRNFEVFIYRNPWSFLPNTLVVGVLEEYAEDVMIDIATNDVYLRNPSNPEEWSFVFQVKDMLVEPENMVEVMWGMDVIVDYTNCACFAENYVPVNQSLTVLTHNTSPTVQAYPNPVGRQITLEFPTSGTIEIFDINGRVWFSGSAQDRKQTIATEHWPAGIYMLRFDDGQTPNIQRLVKL